MSAGSGALLRYLSTDVGYGARTVVVEARLEVGAGEVVGLIGPNGSGKSTLVRSVVGDADVIAGSIEVMGRPVASMSSIERAAVVGVVPQDVTAAFSLPGREFVGMGRNPHLPRFARSSDIDRAAVERAMALTDTASLADSPVDSLSGGDLQRLALAQALAAKPKVLLLDEPTSHLDLNHQLQVLDLVRDLADRDGLAVLAVFHDLNLAARYTDRLAVVGNGSLSVADAPERVLTTETIRRVFAVRSVVGVDPVTGSVSVTPVLRDEAVHVEPRGTVFVVGGSGSAAPLMRRLVLAGWTVSAAALNGGDADATMADALGLDYPCIPPFAPMDSQAAIAAARLADAADAVVVCDVPFGRGNIDNLLVAVRAGKPIVLVGDIEGRDYVGGAARSYWIEAVNNGAEIVADFEAAEKALDRFTTPE
jgi:iron complex transport system ATP-binding protein